MNCFRSRVKALQTVFNKTVPTTTTTTTTTTITQTTTTTTTVQEEPINLKFSK
jgi:hypothetical protein